MEDESKLGLNDVREAVSGHGLNPWIYSTLVFAVTLTVLLVLRKLLWTRLRAWARNSKSHWGDSLVQEIGVPFTALLGVLAFGIAGQSAPAIVRTHPLMIHGTHVALIVVFIWIIERAVSVIFRSNALPDNVSSSTRSLLSTIARFVLFVLGFLIILDNIGVSITPILASLGVGSVAVALALQDTLSNFFGGLYILIDKPIRLDDIVNINDVEGQVVKIGWRSTWIKVGGDIVVLPNNKVATTQIKNFDLPSTASVITISCGVSYGLDLDYVERVALDATRDLIARVDIADKAFEPLLRFTTFGENAINLGLTLQVKRYGDSGLLRHEMIKALHARFQREQIEIPYPQRTVHWNPPTA